MRSRFCSSTGRALSGCRAPKWTVRGFSAVSLLLTDEAGTCGRCGLQSATPERLRWAYGDLWLMSTPYGKRGFFYETWEHGSADWKRVSVAATECPLRIPASFLEEDDRNWERCGSSPGVPVVEFVDNGTEAFGRALVEEALDDDLEPLLGSRRGHEMNTTFFVGLDLGKKQRSDCRRSS